MTPTKAVFLALQPTPAQTGKMAVVVELNIKIKVRPTATPARPEVERLPARAA